MERHAPSEPRTRSKRSVKENVIAEVKVKKGESVDRALRRLKKKLDKEGIMREIRAHKHYEKPSDKRRRKAARARNRLSFNT